MKRKIGEIFDYKGEWYQCVEGRCKYCYFAEQRYLCKQFITKNFCTSNIIFKKLKKVGEPHWLGKRLMQTYNLFTEAIPPLGIECFSIWHEDLTIELEIKQNQEDMEEKKLNLKEFDLEAAKQGKPVCTRDGRKARIICFDRKGIFNIVALIDGEIEFVQSYTNNGRLKANDLESELDLMMLPEKHEGWVNILRYSNDNYVDNIIYATEELAKEAATKKNGVKRIATVKIKWEE